jgi:pimeloyl-ACP methyl ester carboxylesterase
MTAQPSAGTSVGRRFAGLGGDLVGTIDSRPPLVLLPGLTFTRDSGHPVLAQLAEVDPDRRVLNLDLPGHGESKNIPQRRMADVVALLREAVDAAGLDAPVLVGHSISGGLVSLYAGEHPCRGVVNLDAPPDLGPIVRLLRSCAEQIRGDGLPQVWQMMLASFHLEVLPAVAEAVVHATSHPDPVLIRSYWAQFLDSSPDVIDAWVAASMRRVGDAGVPYLLILGASLPADVRAEIHANLPNSAVEVWSGSGHFPHLAHPRRLAARLAATARWTAGERPTAA